MESSAFLSLSFYRFLSSELRIRRVLMCFKASCGKINQYKKSIKRTENKQNRMQRLWGRYTLNF